MVDNALRVTFRFQEERSDPPPWAETHMLSDFQIEEERESIYVPGRHVTVTHPSGDLVMCPRCENRGHLDHGDRAVCGGCGLNMETYGNALTIWDNKWPFQA